MSAHSRFLGAAAFVFAACTDITPAPPPAARLAFLVQPSNALAGSAISPAVTVAVQDEGGKIASTAIVAVTMALGANSRGATLTGTTTVNVVKGVATFNNLSIQQVNTGYTLTASFWPAYERHE